MTEKDNEKLRRTTNAKDKIEGMHRSTKGVAGRIVEVMRNKPPVSEAANEDSNPDRTIPGKVALIGAGCASPEKAREVVKTLCDKAVVQPGDDVAIYTLEPKVTTPEQTREPRRAADAVANELVSQCEGLGQIEVIENVLERADPHNGSTLTEGIEKDPNTDSIIVVPEKDIKGALGADKVSPLVYSHLQHAGAAVLDQVQADDGHIENQWGLIGATGATARPYPS